MAASWLRNLVTEKPGAVLLIGRLSAAVLRALERIATRAEKSRSRRQVVVAEEMNALPWNSSSRARTMGSRDGGDARRQIELEGRDLESLSSVEKFWAAPPVTDRESTRRLQSAVSADDARE